MISIEDLFYNVPSRRKTIKNTAEEYNKIVEVIKRYAIDNPTVGFSCKKVGESTPEMATAPNGNLKDNIKSLFKDSALANSLIPISCENDFLGFKMNGQASNTEYVGSKRNFILFINKRLVTCKSMKRAISDSYNHKGIKLNYFVYLSLQINPNNVDVNVHPTKEEVAFLNEDKIIENVVRAIKNSVKFDGIVPRPLSALEQEKKSIYSSPSDFTKEPSQYSSSNSFDDEAIWESALKNSRDTDPDFDPKRPNAPFQKNGNLNSSNKPNFQQAPLSFKGNNNNNSQNGGLLNEDDEMMEAEMLNQSSSSNSSFNPSAKITTSSNNNNLFGSSSSSIVGSGSSIVKGEKKRKTESSQSTISFDATPAKKKKSKEPEMELTSTKNLLDAVKDMEDEELSSIMCSHKFIGMIGGDTCAIQHKGSVYLVNVTALSKEVFYQTVLTEFGKLRSFPLDHPPNIYDLMFLSFDEPSSGYTPDIGDKVEIARNTKAELLNGNRPSILKEYFGIEINREMGTVVRLPLIIDDYIPSMDRLPSFFIGLASRVNWEEEEACFQGISRELAEFYAIEAGEEDEAISGSQYVSKPTESSKSKESFEFPSGGVVYSKQNKDDHPLQRALEFSSNHPEGYVWARTNDNTTARTYVVQPVEEFYALYSQMSLMNRVYHDVARESYPIKLYIDIEWDTTIDEINRERESEIDDMMDILKSYLVKQWERDTETEAPTDFFLEFDASTAGKKVSRHLHNDKMIFFDSEHLWTFMRRLIKTINADHKNGNTDATKLIIMREKGKEKEKKKEMIVDMLVYHKNMCLRLPGSTKSGELRPLYQVVNREIKRDVPVPDLDIFARVLTTYWPDGTPPQEPFMYSPENFEERKIKETPHTVLSPMRKLDIEKTPYQKLIEYNLLNIVRKTLRVPSHFVPFINKILDAKVHQKCFDSNAKSIFSV
eukprot:TRINITY_DN877_c0_g2_i1.p1 TRINITY_DN877_c0_g2~~TRINITY_DN877_c0_g2_i1.p1  ORF type:complete len:1104 (+),score=379.04 TRINITY_DN877_c0_g2_i1:496-3312(+)